MDYSGNDNSGNSYVWNFCGPVVTSPACGGIQNSDSCQNPNSAAPKSLGVTSTTIITASITKTLTSLSFYSTGGSTSSACVNYRSTNITVTCVPGSPTMTIGAVSESTVLPAGASASCLYLINMQSGDVCPGNIPSAALLDPTQALILTKLQASWGEQLGWSGNVRSEGCSWEGVTCDQSGSVSYIVELDLASQNLNGSLPDAIGSLTTLQKLDLSENSFTGSIPASFMLLPQLKKLKLKNNQLSGSIPDFAPTSPIVTLALQFNQLSGSLPKSLSQLGFLDKLSLQNNQLTGTVPNFVCILSSYNLQRNSWDCPVPACCGEFGNLQCLPCTPKKSS